MNKRLPPQGSSTATCTAFSGWQPARGLAAVARLEIRMARTLLPSIMLVGLAGCVLAGCSASSDRPADAPPMIRVGYVGHDHQLAMYVAALESESRKDRWGVYLRALEPKETYELIEGDAPIARLRFIQTEGGAGMPAAMSRGEFDVGLGSTIGIAKFADSGQPLRILCPLQTDGDQFVVRNELPVTDWDSFVAAARSGQRPLRIGYKEPMAVAKMIFECALRAEGITYGFDDRPQNGVVLVSLGSEKAPVPLLASGALDGLVMNQPATAITVHKGLARVVAELRDLPPQGKWTDHPCCCVGATDNAIVTYRKPLQALLKLVLLSTQLINDDRDLAVDCAVRWTKNEREVESRSVPSVTYLAEPTDAWITGMQTWLEMVRPVGYFTGEFADLSGDAFVEEVCRLDLCREAARELRARGLLRDP